MHIINVNLPGNPYPIIVGSDILRLIGKYAAKLSLGTDAYIITNKAIKRRCGKIVEKSLKASGFGLKFKTVPDSEKSKSIEITTQVLKDLACFDVKKRVFIIALGGGVIGDLSGFIASIYKRGIPYLQVPTTLLAQVDSSIGGKTALDLTQGKNLVGAFYQPRLVLSDIKLLKTLPQKQIRSGLSEVIKYGIIKDADLFTYLEKNYKHILKLDLVKLEHIVSCSSKIKANVVAQDEKETKGLRTILNFGHTLGHAIEAAADYSNYNHGDAVALGMLVASDISRSLDLISLKTQNRIENLIKQVGLPSRIKLVNFNKIINAHYHDKKFLGKNNKFVLISSIGKTEIVKNVPLDLIKEAVKRRI